jgi:hypothetical protein
VGVHRDNTKAHEIFALDGDFNYRIRVSGENWDQYIDWRLAKLITDFQKSINAVIKENNLSVSKDTKDKTTIKFKVSEGSSIIEINCGNLLKFVADTMTGGQITAVVITGILVTGGLYTLKALNARKEKAEDEATKRELAKVIEKVAGYEKPIRGLLSRMDKNDSVEFSTEGKKLSRS